MNQDQVVASVRGALIALGPAIIALGVPNGAWQIALSLVPTLAGFVWSIMAHTQAATVQSAAALPGVKVEVDPTASRELVDMARDPKVKDVVEASPSTSPYATSAKSSRAL